MPIALPTPLLRLTPAEAGAIAQRGRKLLRRGRITAHQHALLDTLLWAARKPGEAVLTASYKALARLAGQARSTAAVGIRQLEKLGLIQRIRRRVRVAWISRATASRQIANAYRLLVADTGSEARPGREREIQILISSGQEPAAVRNAQAALARRCAEMQARLLRNKDRASAPRPVLQH